MSAPPGFNGLWRYDWDSPQFDQRAADAMGCLSLATKSTVTSAVALTGNAANLVDGTIIKSGDVLTIASTGRGTATNITFGASESLAQLNAALAANNLTASLDSSNKLVITTTNDVASSTIGVVAYPGAGTGTLTFGAVAAAVAPPPHGTYTRVQYFRVHMSDKNGLTNAVLDVFNEDGDFGRFSWNGTDAWQADPTPVTFTATAGKLVTKDAQITLTPNLALDRYDTTNFPSNAQAGKGYVKSVTTPMPATQRIVPDPSGKWFTWYLAEGDFGLDFKSCYQQQSASTDNKDKSFGDTFLGQSKLAQLGFPYYGFNPSKMGLYPPADQSGASQPYELSVTGPGTPSAGVISTNPRQTFNGTLVFAFPRDNSKDYVRAEDLPDQPFLPLGLGAAPIESKDESTHTEMVSSLEDRMRSWSVTLGLSANLGKVVDLSASSSFGNKIEEQNKSESRYTVSRRITKAWAIRADIPSHRLHEDFIDHVQSATAAVLSDSPPRWESFVTSFGTHYAHAITQGAIDYAETRFDLQAETTAYTKKLDLKASASVVIDAVGVGGKGEWNQEWSDKTGLDVSNEDVTSFSIAAADEAGHPMPMGIFFDLRPLDELFSPVFFPYNPADGWGQLAPFVWHEVRASFAAHLQKQAQHSAVGIDFSQNYTPRKFSVGFDEMQMLTPNFNADNIRRWYGTIKLQGVDGNGIEMHDFDLPSSQALPPDETIDVPTANFWCYLAAKAVNQDSLQFTWDIDLHVVDGDGNAIADLKATNLPVAIPLPGGWKQVSFVPNGYTVFCTATAQPVGLLQS